MAKHQHNRKFFDQLTSKSCYWGGFFAADGCVGKWGALQFGLGGKDRDQLEKFKVAIESTSPVSNINRGDGYSSVQLHIYGAYECQIALEQHFNITPAKSLTLQPPNLVEEAHICHFIRGYVDGDGSISWSNQTHRKGHWQLGIIGTKQMLEWIKLQLHKHAVEVGNPSVSPARNAFQLVFGGEQIVRILDWLYLDSLDETRLTRKYKKYLEAKQYYKLYPTRVPKSKYRGVSQNRIGKWTAEIKEPKGQRYHLGCFVTEREAAIAYNTKAKELGLLSRCYEVVS